MVIVLALAQQPVLELGSKMETNGGTSLPQESFAREAVAILLACERLGL